MASPGPVTEVVQASGPHVPALLERVERRLAALSEGHGPELAEHGGATIAAGGKRLRPLLVAIAAGDEDGEGVVRSGVAVELVHSATLVHDDVLDAASLRRGAPTVVAAGGRAMAIATGDLLFARAFAELAARGRPEAISVLSGASSALAHGELLQRADAWDAAIGIDRYLLRCELKTARLFDAACRLGALEADGPAAELGPSARHRAGVPAARRRPGRVGPRRAHGQAPGHRPARRHGDPAAAARPERDPALAALDPRTVTTPEQARDVCDAIEATGALDCARERALGLVAAAKEELPAACPPASARRSSSSPTAWSRATREA